jgi:hypothetical protein
MEQEHRKLDVMTYSEDMSIVQSDVSIVFGEVLAKIQHLIEGIKDIDGKLGITLSSSLKL